MNISYNIQTYRNVLSDTSLQNMSPLLSFCQAFLLPDDPPSQLTAIYNAQMLIDMRELDRRARDVKISCFTSHIVDPLLNTMGSLETL
jgi:hypothetical protein